MTKGTPTVIINKPNIVDAVETSVKITVYIHNKKRIKNNSPKLKLCLTRNFEDIFLLIIKNNAKATIQIICLQYDKIEPLNIKEKRAPSRYIKRKTK